MRAVVLGPRPPALDALIAKRKALGLDGGDEVWKGEYHTAPAAHSAHGMVDDEVAVRLRPHARRVGLIGTGPFNLGAPDDFRVPDRGFHRSAPRGVWVPTAAIAVEIVSSDDEAWDKLGFYAAHEVDELLIVDPIDHSVVWSARTGDHYEPATGSRLLGITATEIHDEVEWPPSG
jgi:hypothetical protein